MITVELISLTVLLEYIYTKFAVTFILSIIGVSIREMFIAITVDLRNKDNHIRVGKILVLSLFSTVLMCAIGDYVHVGFSIYVLLCILMGMWSHVIIRVATDNKVMKAVLVKLVGSIAKPLEQSVSDAIDAVDKEDKSSENKDTELSKK